MSLYMYSLFETEHQYRDGGDADFEAIMALHRDFAVAVKDAGAKIVSSEALQPTSTATYLRNTCTPQVDVVDNPLPDVKEVLGGYYLIDAPDDGTARKLAELAPAPYGYVEMRPIWVFS